MTAAHARIVTIISEQLGVDEEEVTPEASFIMDLGADSLDCVEVVMTLEDEFDIEITDEEAERMARVKEVYDFIDKKVAAKRPK